jgi:secretion/DNA translocation related CpaE-like protein
MSDLQESAAAQGTAMDDRPLIITDDELVLDDLLRLAAAAGVDVVHTREADPRAMWRSAPLVLIDAAMLSRAVAARLPRRSGVVVIASTEPGSDVWAHCVRLGADRTLLLDGSEEVLVGLLSDAAAGGTGNGRCVAVLGACGGAGASVFASSLALAAARDGSGSGVLLIDCDPWGAGLDLMLGIEDAPGLRWADLAARSGRLPVDALAQAIPGVSVGSGRVGVLCHGRRPAGEVSADVVAVVLDAGRRSGAVTVVDLPRQPGPAADRVLEQADLIVLVSPADVRGCWAAERVCLRIRQFGSVVGIVVRGPSPGGMGAVEMADFLGLPLLARMRPVSSLPRELEYGLAPGAGRRRPLDRAARAVLLALREAS